MSVEYFLMISFIALLKNFKEIKISSFILLKAQITPPKLCGQDGHCRYSVGKVYMY